MAVVDLQIGTDRERNNSDGDLEQATGAFLSLHAHNVCFSTMSTYFSPICFIVTSYYY